MGDISDLSNYRPISLATIMSKLVERLLLTRLEDFYVLLIISSALRRNTLLIWQSLLLSKSFPTIRNILVLYLCAS